MADAIRGQAPGTPQPGPRPQTATHGPGLAALLAELDRPLDAGQPIRGLQDTPSPRWAEGLMTRLRREREDDALLERARAAAHAALGVTGDRETRLAVQALMEGRRG